MVGVVVAGSGRATRRSQDAPRARAPTDPAPPRRQVINFWQDDAAKRSVEDARAAYPDCTFSSS